MCRGARGFVRWITEGQGTRGQGNEKAGNEKNEIERTRRRGRDRGWCFVRTVSSSMDRCDLEPVIYLSKRADALLAVRASLFPRLDFSSFFVVNTCGVSYTAEFSISLCRLAVVGLLTSVQFLALGQEFAHETRSVWIIVEWRRAGMKWVEGAWSIRTLTLSAGSG